jgi:putative acyl-CoA dehydrogenase
MTAAAVPSLLNDSWSKEYLLKLCTPGYDPRDVPVSEKTSITAGMSMTEKQGGSDVRSNTTIATPQNPAHIGPGSSYLLTGHKVFSKNI